MRYYIIGYKNSGKTTFGRKLAECLNMGFIDVDEYLEQKEKKSIPELYTALGEEKFRHAEWKALKEVSKNDNVVVATGGGAPCNCDNMNIMEKTGEVIYLKVSEATLLNRLSVAAHERPIVKGKNEQQLKEYLNDLRERCEHHYLRAKYTVDGEKILPEELADDLKRQIVGLRFAGR